MDQRIKNVCNYCHIIRNKIAEGGQSTIYLCDYNNSKCIRTIPIDRQWKHIKNEIIVSDFASKLTENVTPNFIYTYEFTYCKDTNSIHQIVDKYDGDIDKFNLEGRNDFLIQILTSIYCLMRKGIRHNDIKAKNILYKKLDEPINITYKFRNKYFNIVTDNILVLTDFGISQRCPELKGQFECNPWMNMKDFISLLKIFHIEYDKHTKCHLSYEESIISVSDYLYDLLINCEINVLENNKTYDLDTELPELDVNEVLKCFDKKLIGLYLLF